MKKADLFRLSLTVSHSRERERDFDWQFRSKFIGIDWCMPRIALVKEHLVKWMYYHVLSLAVRSRGRKWRCLRCLLSYGFRWAYLFYILLAHYPVQL